MGRTLIVAILLVWSACSLPILRAEDGLRIACWNVENLFDTIPNPPCLDADFTPDGAYHWGAHRYWYKLGTLSRTIAGLGGHVPCTLVGLVEIENDSVLHDLTRRTALARLGYEYLITHGTDPRGINVGLLYQPMRFAPIGQDDLRVAPPITKKSKNRPHPTRDILHTWGRLQCGDTLDVFVLHLPSRRGGKMAKTYRQTIAQRLMQYADSIQSERQNSLLLFMGDFNAPSGDVLFRKEFASLQHLTRHLAGTYYFRQEWSQIDHMLVNKNLWTRYYCDVRNHKASYLLRSTASDDVPYRTYLGTYYQGGVSDHLPVIMDMTTR